MIKNNLKYLLAVSDGYLRCYSIDDNSILFII